MTAFNAGEVGIRKVNSVWSQDSSGALLLFSERDFAEPTKYEPP